MTFFASRIALLRAATATAVAFAAMTWSAPAQADACGSRVLTPTEVTVAIDPPVECLVATLEGTDHAGCEDIRVIIENGCSTDAEVLETNVQCHERDASEVQTRCSIVPPGSASFVFVQEVAEGANEVDVDVQLDGTTHTVHVEYVTIAEGDLEGGEPGCSIALPGRARAGLTGLAIATAAAASAAARRRTRVRAG